MKYMSLNNILFIVLFFFSMMFFSLGLFFLFNNFTLMVEYNIINLNSTSIIMLLLFDWMSCLFMSFVFFISCLVIFYSKEYMSSDYNMNRFIFLILAFVISMAFMIISPNLISILLGWDGLGLISYCLVIYFQNVKSYNAGMLTFLSNRVGDVALLMCIAWMLNYGSWNFMFYLNFINEDFEMLMIGGLVILAAMTKSAQIPFSSWLPAAMAAPTPVSALVHSSTLVTAGVYLLIRFNIFFTESILSQYLLLIAGLTMFMSGMGANFEFDLKKIIALSTLSQLGLMMSILSMGFVKIAFFHLLTHALFKALLFMCAGVIIHSMKNFQDIRVMGSLVNYMPVTITYFNIANLALCGMPFLAGFYSKDLILEIVLLSNINIFSFLLYFVSTGLTVCYSFRLMYYSLSGDFNFFSMHIMNDEGYLMLKSMSGLMLMSLLGGSMLSWLIFPNPMMICMPMMMKLLILFTCILGGIIGYMISNVSLYFNNKIKNYNLLSSFLGDMWFMPLIFTCGISFFPLNYSMTIKKSLDSGWKEFFGGQKIYESMKISSIIFNVLNNNYFKIYFLLFFIWFMILFIFMI
uniref:NADH dehydrogenase subunit 5 n=1 Tax=Psychoda alternata TaxID=114594 RepID=UPI0022DCD8EA|nr:NADH dehydrogenase subunit 5 [Psychoda alternata]AQX36173.1 NADH dehydrogenase subunit 5 [Psychoda alternata]